MSWRQDGGDFGREIIRVHGEFQGRESREMGWTSGDFQRSFGPVELGREWERLESNRFSASRMSEMPQPIAFGSWWTDFRDSVVGQTTQQAEQIAEQTATQLIQSGAEALQTYIMGPQGQVIDTRTGQPLSAEQAALLYGQLSAIDRFLLQYGLKREHLYLTIAIALGLVVLTYAMRRRPSRQDRIMIREVERPATRDRNDPGTTRDRNDPVEHQNSIRETPVKNPARKSSRRRRKKK